MPFTLFLYLTIFNTNSMKYPMLISNLFLCFLSISYGWVFWISEILSHFGVRGVLTVRISLFRGDCSDWYGCHQGNCPGLLLNISTHFICGRQRFPHIPLLLLFCQHRFAHDAGQTGLFKTADPASRPFCSLHRLSSSSAEVASR